MQNLRLLLIVSTSLTFLGSIAATTLPLVKGVPTSATCKPVKFTLSTTAQNFNLTGPTPHVSNYTQVSQWMNTARPTFQLSKTYDIIGQYCTPAKQHAGSPAPIIVAVHGITYDHRYFNGLRDDAVSSTKTVPYSFVDYATKQGFYTLTIDRLGSGNSSKPNGLLEVQAPVQAELINSLIQTHLQPFDTVTYIGHSYGSVIGTNLASKHPTSLNALILTGIAQPNSSDSSFPALFSSDLISAPLYNSTRFPPSQGYDLSYLFISNQEARRNLFYSYPSDFDPTIENRDFNTSGTFTLGEIFTSSPVNATHYRGPAFVATGIDDAIYCGNGTYTAADCAPANGQRNFVEDFVRDYLPSARTVRTYLQERAGHCASLHYSWESTFQEMFAWLGEVGV